MPDNFALDGAAGEKVFGDFAFDGAGLHVPDFVPFGAAFAAREDDAAAAFIPGIALVLTQDEELDAVEGRECIQREAEGLGDEGINLCRDYSLIPFWRANGMDFCNGANKVVDMGFRFSRRLSILPIPTANLQRLRRVAVRRSAGLTEADLASAKL